MAASGSIVSSKKQFKDVPQTTTTAVCLYCERSFNTDRILKHQEICGKLFDKRKMSEPKAEDSSAIKKINVFPKRNWRANNDKCLDLIRSAKDIWAKSRQTISRYPDFLEKTQYQIADSKLSSSSFFMKYPSKGFEVNETKAQTNNGEKV